MRLESNERRERARGWYGERPGARTERERESPPCLVMELKSLKLAGDSGTSEINPSPGSICFQVK